MLLLCLLLDDIMGNINVKDTMRPSLFRQWVACVTMVAVLFSAVVPLGVCRCEDCHCEKSISRFLLDRATEHETCCCIPPEEKCCKLPVPCLCVCCNTQNDDAIDPKAVLPVKKPKVGLSWDNVSVFPVDLANVSGISSLLGTPRALPPPHVPLHVLLCVFLN